MTVLWGLGEEVAGGLILVVVFALWRRYRTRVMLVLRGEYESSRRILIACAYFFVAIAGALVASLVTADEHKLPALYGRGIKILQGSISIERKHHPHIWNVSASHCPPWAEGGRRGMLNEGVAFDEPFSEPPVVFSAFDRIDTGHDGRPIRIFMDIMEVDEKGFRYNLFTSCNSKVVQIHARWIAIGSQ